MKGLANALLLLVLTAAALTGCGGDDSRLKAQFIEEGEAICRQAAIEQKELASRYEGKAAPGKFEIVISVFVPPMEKELHRLEALRPPESDDEEVSAILSEFESGIETAKADYLDPFVKATDPFARANELARRYGFEACAESSHAVIEPQD